MDLLGEEIRYGNWEMCTSRGKKIRVDPGPMIDLLLLPEIRSWRSISLATHDSRLFAATPAYCASRRRKAWLGEEGRGSEGKSSGARAKGPRL